MTLEDEIAAAEARRHGATVRADIRELEECLSERLVYVHSTGRIEDRAQWLAALASGRRRYLAYAPGARRIADFGGTVTCVGELGVRALVAGQAVDTTIAFTAIYAREGAALRLAGWHSCAASAA